ncbi:uncharacterized protein LOC125279311 [Megalobrama amblycephala]|uniref:uncharacterized protein LOC125279311 n=1 Tax=Megalobrama amblycephala TaxID=75352 RepID=UPI002013D269|nr:uncharacterized protein LOC125279311 [Megalobrama amblycephala]
MRAGPLLKDDDESDESFTDIAGLSTGSNEKLRLMMLGGDDALLNKACATILGERQNRDAFKFGVLEPRKAQVRGRQVSVLKTPSYWLEHLKSFLFFIRGVKAIRNDMKFFESQLFPGPHAFLFVHRDVKDSGRRDEEDLRKHDSQSYTNMTEDQEQDQPDESFTDVVGSSTGSNEKLRLMLLGGNDVLLDKACATILRKRNRKTPFKFGKLEPRNANACGRQVSVLKTPFTWLDQLKSYLFFSKGVKAIRDEMESYESMLFPGPHAFLLVHRDVKYSGRDNYLLRALSDVFGEEVLDYCMVLFIDRAKHNDPTKNYCLKMCGGRCYILHNTDYSVNELFKKIESMAESKDSSFFTTHLEFFRKASNYFQEEYEEKENKLRKELNDSKGREIQLRGDIEKLQRQMEELKEQLENNLTDARVKEDGLHERERNVHKREKQLDERQKELEIREREVKQRDVRSREHHQTTVDPPPAVSENKDRPLNEREGELKSRKDSQSTGSLGIQNPVKRNSINKSRPNMSRKCHQTTADPPPAECEEELKSRDDSQISGSPGIQKPVRRNSKELCLHYSHAL